MMFYKILTLALFGLSTAILPQSAAAQITLNKSANMNFGILGYDLTHSGNVRLGTDGNITIIGGVGLAPEGGNNAAAVSVSGTPADVIEIKCETTGKLVLSGNDKIDLINSEVSVDVGVPFGSGNQCQGVKKNSTPAMTVDLATNPDPVIFMGAELTINANSLSSGTYDTIGGAGAKPVQLTVIFQ